LKRSLGKREKFFLKTSWVWGYTFIIPAIQEVESGASPGNSTRPYLKNKLKKEWGARL
jgi:hypothetical protein